MTRPRRDDPLAEAVKKREAREKQAREEGERSPWENLAMIGSIAWQIVLPPLLGAAIGRWVDDLTGHSVLYSAAGIIAGVDFGFWTACCRTPRK